MSQVFTAERVLAVLKDIFCPTMGTSKETSK